MIFSCNRNKYLFIFLISIIFIKCKKDEDLVNQVIPIPPSGLTGTLLEPLKTKLNWEDNSTNEDGFVIERKEHSTDFQKIAMTSADISQFIDSNLNENTSYEYRVYSYNLRGKSLTYSNIISITTPLSMGSKLKKDILLYLPFSKNANDSSGNDYHALVNNALLTADRFNKAESAYQFSTLNSNLGKQDNEIYVPYTNAFNIDSFTVSVWINPNQYVWPGNLAGKYSVIINRFEGGYSNPNSQVWGIQFSSTELVGYILAGATNNNQQKAEVIGPTVPLNKWTHICMRYTGNKLDLFFDGEPAASTSTTIQINKQSISGISIGQSRQANGFWYNYSGKIDDVRIWKRGLNNDEIEYLSTH